MRGRVRRVLAAGLLAVTLAGCATFPDDRPRAWQEQIDGAGELGGIPRVPDPGDPRLPPDADGQSPPEAPVDPGPCADPDPLVIETCLGPVGAIAVLPGGASALVGERTTGRVLRVEQGTDPVLVATVPVDPTGDGGLTGLVLSPSYTEDRLVYAYATTPADNRVMLIATGEAPKPLFTGIPRGAVNNGGALAVDVDGSLLVATGDAGGAGDDASLAGKLLRLDTRGRPAAGNPDPASPVLSSGLTAPGGICVDVVTTAAWVTDRAATQDVLHRVVPGALGAPAWSWPDRPGVGGCAVQQEVVAVAQRTTAAMFLLRTDPGGAFTATESVLQDEYGRLGPATLAPDGLIWVGTLNRSGGTPVLSDDRVIRLPPFASGGASRA